MTNTEEILQHQAKVEASLGKSNFPPRDDRQARIDALEQELRDRECAINLINQSGGFDKFNFLTVKMKGQIEGLRESLTLAPPAPPESEAHFED